MTFLTPWMLFGALAAGIPVAIHLFFRSRYRTVPWAAMKFLLTSVEQTSRRLKFQELLLLLLRMALLAMLAVAFARPISSIVRGAGRGDSVDAVFVFDTSFSMGANDGDAQVRLPGAKDEGPKNKTRLDRAKEEAIKLIDELPAHSTVQIITCAGNNKAVLGPHSPANLDQAKQIVQDLGLTSLATDLYLGVAEAQGVLLRGQASNKELYVFSDMQKMGFEQQAGELKRTLQEIREKAVVHLVRCGTRTPKNVAIVGITPQSGVPRPGDRVGFAVLVRNTGTEAVENLTVTLTADGDEKNRESQSLPKLPGSETYAVTLNAKFEKSGLHVLTARVTHDDLDGDNQFDQVILVRDQVNILVVDGNFDERDRDPEKASSFYLMHNLLPVREAERASYKFNPRMVPARSASPALLAKQDVCILVNCSLQAKLGQRSGQLPADFVEALDPFVRQGHALVIFGGDNVQPEPYNKLLSKKFALLPMPLKAAVKATDNKPFLINRNSFGEGPAAFWKFKDDKLYEDFGKVEVWQYLQMDEQKSPDKMKKEGEPEKKEKADDDNPVSVVIRLNNDMPLVASRKVDAGQVIFLATAAHSEGVDPKTLNPLWTDFHLSPDFIPFFDVLITHLMHGQTQTYNLVAGQTLTWFPTEKQENIYELVHPGGKVVRLDPPTKINKRYVVTASDLPHAGIYRMVALARGSESVTPPNTKSGMPIAVIPDLNESKDLATLTDAKIDEQLGFVPIHITAGVAESALTGADRLNREWTVWALMAVLALVLAEVLMAWWCGKAW